jgi:hypothetical protein
MRTLRRLSKMYDPDYDWHDDYETELRRRPRYISCCDGYCGAEDCPRCRPWSYRYGEDDDDITDLLN